MPVVDHGECIKCGICVELCPAVFSFSETGYVAVAEQEEYPGPEVEEAIKYCPADCIHWEER